MTTEQEERRTPAGTVPVVCRMLRTKRGFGSPMGGAAWQDGVSTTAAYWCLRTMEPAGPDDGYAHPRVCGEGRSCFLPPDV